MIKINLIPVKEKKKQKEFLMVLAVGAVCIVVLCLMFWVYMQKKMTVNNLDKEIAQIQEESKAYEQEIKEYNELKDKEASLNAFKGTIKNISETQRKLAVAVDQFALNLPNGVWLTRIAQGGGTEANKFTIQGYAFGRRDLENYIEALKKPGGLFKSAALDIKSISAGVGQNRQIHQFEISAVVSDQGS